MVSAALPNQSNHLRVLLNLNDLRHQIYLQVIQIFDVVVYEIEVKFRLSGRPCFPDQNRLFTTSVLIHAKEKSWSSLASQVFLFCAGVQFSRDSIRAFNDRISKTLYDQKYFSAKTIQSPTPSFQSFPFLFSFQLYPIKLSRIQECWKTQKIKSVS